MGNSRVLAGVVSDTHITAGSADIFMQLVESCFRDCDLIIHAGDITDPEIFTGIEKQIIAVRGNMDTVASYPVKRVLNLMDARIGVIHGCGSPEGIEARIRKEFDDVDCIVYGHTHFPRCESVDGILFFNPGSPFDKRRASGRTVGYLHIEGKNVTGSIVTVEEA